MVRVMNKNIQFIGDVSIKYEHDKHSEWKYIYENLMIKQLNCDIYL